MITASELQLIASEHNYEKILREKARIGHTETRLFFASEDVAIAAKKALHNGNVVCTKLENHFSREGTDFSFVAKWGK